jgi:hypothetical protein
MGGVTLKPSDTFRPQAPYSLSNFCASGFLLKNKSIGTIQQYIRANIPHVLVKMQALITHFDAQAVNVASREVTFDGNCSSA